MKRILLVAVLLIIAVFILTACGICVESKPGDCSSAGQKRGIFVDHRDGIIYYPVDWGRVIDSEVSHGGGGITITATFENGESVVINLGVGLPKDAIFVFKPR